MKPDQFGTFPEDLGKLIDEAYARMLQSRRYIESWAQLRKDAEPPTVLGVSG